MGLATESLLAQVRKLVDGKLVIPSIQRDYVWRRSQVTQLLDSLYRGYPVGALLIWKTNIEVPLRTVAVVSGASATHNPAYLLDGQQRLTTLAWVIYPHVRPEERSLDTRFDLQTETFLNPSAPQRRDPFLIPVSDILAEGAQFAPLLKQAGVTPDMPEYQTMYERLHKVAQIRGYQLPVITHESDDYEEVAEIFARVNQGGRRLSQGDLVDSAIAARWNEGLKEVDSFFVEIDREGFLLNRETVLRLMSILAGQGGSHLRLIRPEMTKEKLQSAWRDTERALRLAIDFMKGECGVPQAAVLTSPNVMVIPAYLLFRRNGALDPEEAVALRRWVYTAMAFGRYSNQVETKLEAEAELVDTETGAELFRALLRLAGGARTGGTPLHPSVLEHLSTSSPFFNLLYIEGLRRQAKDSGTNGPQLDAPMASMSSIVLGRFIEHRRIAMVNVLNEMLGLPTWTPAVGAQPDPTPEP